ncbi:MAG: hypothetical protein K2M84_03135 [Anaeroplasmataceae bacterium]|nr:hypothetical protein [Anaeroplasmataceae bacterium]MDE7384734.1 hypothetical protein [Anaeroplasmataceae bacterium]
MLEQLYKKGYLNYEELIFDQAKALGLNAEEVFVLIHILKNHLVTNTLSVEEIQAQVLMSPSKLDKLVASLMERGFYEVYLTYDNGKGMECISFKPLFTMLEQLLEQKTSLDTYDIEKANKYISSKLNRVLTASELEILQGFMIDDHYTYDQIAAVVDNILASKKVLSLRSIALGLANKRYEVKPSQEAPASFQDFLKRI